MTCSLSVLILENDVADFDLVAHELWRFGFIAECKRVETEAEYMVELGKRPDVILADYVLTRFDALRALELLQESGLLIPFIVLTGAVSEETMVECMRRGASDYLLKDRVLRLGPAVRRALDEGELRRQKKAAENALVQKNIELEQQIHKAEAASRMKSTFLANMSHELRTPLTVILGFTELLVDGKVGELTSDQVDLLEDVLSNAKHLLGLINDILDMAKVESGTMVFRPERASIPHVVDEAIAALKVIAEEKRVSMVSQIRIGETEAFLDIQRLRQVLFNYISNSLKFTPAGGKITVSIVPEADAFFRLEVADTGVGIAPEDIGRLFRDFQQLDDSLAKRVQGTGLGLALTKRLVEAQGGTVGVTSVLGEGSTFFAVLPRVARPILSDLTALASVLSETEVAAPVVPGS